MGNSAFRQFKTRHKGNNRRRNESAASKKMWRKKPVTLLIMANYLQKNTNLPVCLQVTDCTSLAAITMFCVALGTICKSAWHWTTWWKLISLLMTSADIISSGEIMRNIIKTEQNGKTLEIWLFILQAAMNKIFVLTIVGGKKIHAKDVTCCGTSTENDHPICTDFKKAISRSLYITPNT